MSEQFIPSPNHWVITPGLYKERVTTKQLQSLLLNQPDPIVRGMWCQWKSKRIGPGVYELWVEERP